VTWSTKVVIPEGSPPQAYIAYLEMIALVARRSRVPKNATWRAFKRGATEKGTIHWLVAEWRMRDAAY